MHLFFKSLNFYYAPDGISGPAGGGGGNDNVEDNTNIQDDISFLADDTDGTEDTDDNDSPEDKDKKAIKADEDLLAEDDDKEGEEDTDDEGEEDIDPETGEKRVKKEAKEEKKDEAADEDPVKAATYSSIKKKYPNFFKEFPGIKSQLFSADAFRRIFPTVEDAKVFKEESETTINAFSSVRDMVAKGETDNFLSEVKGIGPEAYKNFVANFMPALYGNDKDTYYAIATPIVRTAIRNIYDRGLKNGGKKGGTEDNHGQNLVNAALVLHHALFENGEVEAEDKPLVTEKKTEAKDPEKEKFEKERNEFYTGKYNTLHNDVNTSIRTTIREEIGKGLNQTLPTYIKNKLVDDIFAEIDKTVGKDEIHLNSVNALWKKEQSAGFTGVNKQSIINAVLSRARPLIPSIRKRVAQEALKDYRVPKKEAKDTREEKGERKPVSGNSKNREKPNLRDTSKMSDLDILNMD